MRVAVSGVVPANEAMQEGRTLLRILEHGSGPSIEIAWPSSMSDRERLYATFRDCFGMRVAVMTDAGVLYALDDGSRDAWDIDLDTYSGFVRHPEGRMTATERGLLRNVPAAAPGARLVRIFPRRVDAVLLGGLQALIGSGYGEAGSIRAAYRYVAGSVAVTGILIDGRSIGGSIDLAASAPRRCRAA